VGALEVEETLKEDRLSDYQQAKDPVAAEVEISD
jgi:hypothetical protein